MTGKIVSSLVILMVASSAFAAPGRAVEKGKETEKGRTEIGKSTEGARETVARGTEKQEVGEAAAELAKAAKDENSGCNASCQRMTDVLIKGSMNPESLGLDAEAAKKLQTTMVQTLSSRSSGSLDQAIDIASERTGLDRKEVEEACGK